MPQLVDETRAEIVEDLEAALEEAREGRVFGMVLVTIDAVGDYRRRINVTSASPIYLAATIGAVATALARMTQMAMETEDAPRPGGRAG